MKTNTFNKNEKETFREIRATIEKYQSIVILGHTHPDGDAIGSAQSLSLALKKNYPKKQIYTPYKEKSNWDRVLPVVYSDITNLKWEDSLVILVDCHELSRTNYGEMKPKTMIAIDHHQFIQAPSFLYWIDASRVANCELIYEFLNLNQWIDSVDIASFLFLGIFTDSGSFRFKGVNQRTFSIISKLFSWPIPYQKIEYRENNKTRQDIENFRYLLDNVDWYPQGLFFYYKAADQKNFPVANEKVFTMHINYFRKIEDKKIWVFFTQLKPNDPIRVNARSIGKYDVAKICLQFGGGGHQNAAGCTLKTWADVEQFKSLVEKEWVK